LKRFIREYEIKESHLKENINIVTKVEELKEEYKINTFASFMLAIGEEIKKGKQYTIYEIEEKVLEKKVLFLNGKIVQGELDPIEGAKVEEKIIKVLHYVLQYSEGVNKKIENGVLKCSREKGNSEIIKEK